VVAGLALCRWGAVWTDEREVDVAPATLSRDSGLSARRPAQELRTTPGRHRAVGSAEPQIVSGSGQREHRRLTPSRPRWSRPRAFPLQLCTLPNKPSGINRTFVHTPGEPDIGAESSSPRSGIALLNHGRRQTPRSTSLGLGQAALLRLEEDSRALQLSMCARPSGLTRGLLMPFLSRSDGTAARRPMRSGVRLLMGPVHVSPARGRCPFSWSLTGAGD